MVGLLPGIQKNKKTKKQKTKKHKPFINSNPKKEGRILRALQGTSHVQPPSRAHVLSINNFFDFSRSENVPISKQQTKKDYSNSSFISPATCHMPSFGNPIFFLFDYKKSHESSGFIKYFFFISFIFITFYINLSFSFKHITAS